MSTACPTLAPPSPPARRRRLAAPWAIGFLAVVATLATASARPKPPRDGFPPMPHLVERLALTPDQIAAEKKGHEALRSTAEQTRHTMRAARETLRTLWGAEKPSRDAILSKLAEIDSLRAKLATARVDAHLAFIESLSASQRVELRKLLAEPPRRGKRRDD